jgi:hypothetical protein
MNPRLPPLVMWVVEMRQDQHDTPYSQGFENGFTTHAAEGILLGFGESDESCCDRSYAIFSEAISWNT